MGAGLLQIRVRFRIPRPHVALHSDQFDQLLHCPGTEINQADFYNLNNFFGFFFSCFEDFFFFADYDL